MSDNGNETKKYKYLITMKWFVETDEELVAGATETDEKLLNLVRHRSNDSHININRILATNPIKFVVLQNAKDFSL